MQQVPEKYRHAEVEAKWMERWEEAQLYRFDPTRGRDQTFVVDTPPPTVSGSLHVGHVFSYTHTDLVVRYQRMKGKNIMYPMGWDDNGLPTERRVQNKFGITCNPHLPYDPNWKPKEGSEGREEISRTNFIETCNLVTKEDEKAFESLWRQLGLSVDWSEQYETINNHCRTISQLSFLDLVRKKLVYSSESPTMWDVTFQTALAQADIEDRIRPGAYHHLRFAIESGGEFTIATTRPELLVSCIAVVAHPEDTRYQPYFGQYAITPLFRARVPIVASTHADPEKGTGIMMICTFGDAADVEWWKSSGLPIKQVLNKSGRFEPVDFASEPFLSLKPEAAAEAYAALQGKTVAQGRKAVVELLARDGSAADGAARALIGDPQPIEHPVKFYEKGDLPVEFITTRQWFVKLLDFKEELLAQGAKITWHPAFMRSRYDNWVQGLNHDWCISRQRFFGVPFPVWYPIGEDGQVRYDAPLFASADQLPVDPLSECPAGYSEAQRDAAGGFTGDPDVMDTWATSSLTPQIVSRWSLEPDRHVNLFPADMRPQSHEIIRTWAFYTIAKAWMHEGEIPWQNVVISGWILDPDRKKMSKSKGNVVTPQHLLEQYSADAVRYWAARARLGVDTAYDEKIFKNGQKLATKVFNASRFVLTQLEQFFESGLKSELALVQHELDKAIIEELRGVIANASAAFEEFDYAQALQLSESAFWSFCDSFLELVKQRAYAAEDTQDRISAVATLEWTLSVFLRLFAPVLPYVTEEVWSYHFAELRGEPFVHKAAWPTIDEVRVVQPPQSGRSLEVARELLGHVHFAKSRNQKSLKWPVERLVIRGAEESLAIAKLVIDDVCRAGRVNAVEYQVGAPSEEKAAEGKLFEVEVELGAEEAAANP